LGAERTEGEGVGGNEEEDQQEGGHGPQLGQRREAVGHNLVRDHAEDPAGGGGEHAEHHSSDDDDAGEGPVGGVEPHRFSRMRRSSRSRSRRPERASSTKWAKALSPKSRITSRTARP